MKEINFEILKSFLLRLWMIATRGFTLVALLFAHYKTPHAVFIIAACISLPLFFIALYRLAETIRLYANIQENIDQVKKDLVRAENKNYLKKI
jgi:chromate transport protein ChrA